MGRPFGSGCAGVPCLPRQQKNPHHKAATKPLPSFARSPQLRKFEGGHQTNTTLVGISNPDPQFTSAAHRFTTADLLFTSADYLFRPADHRFTTAAHLFNTADHLFNTAAHLFNTADHLFNTADHLFITADILFKTPQIYL